MKRLTVKIVTDSTSSIPPAIRSELGIAVVPTTVHFGTATFIDGVDPAAVFYEQMSTSGVQPTTSTPSPGSFLEIYRKAVRGGDEAVSIHVMETKTSIVSAARVATQLLPGSTIHVVDGHSTSLGLGLLVIEAARAAQAGRSAGEILQRLDRLIPQVHVHAAIREMTQLRRSGRVSLGQALAAGLLSIKPVLYIGDSRVDVVDKARGWPAAVARMADLAVAAAAGRRVRLAVVHTNAEADARDLLERVRERFDAAETLVAEAGPTLAAHAGPGALGIATMPLE